MTSDNAPVKDVPKKEISEQSIETPILALNPPNVYLGRTYWYDRIEIAIEAKEQGRKARAGKPSVFSYSRNMGRG